MVSLVFNIICSEANTDIVNNRQSILSNSYHVGILSKNDRIASSQNDKMAIFVLCAYSRTATIILLQVLTLELVT